MAFSLAFQKKTVTPIKSLHKEHVTEKDKAKEEEKLNQTQPKNVINEIPKEYLS